MKTLRYLLVLTLLVSASQSLFAQRFLIGPRLTGNLSIYNAKGLTGTWNGVGIGVGGCVDISFSKHIGILTNLTVFDMKGFSNSQTIQNVTVDNSISLSYFTIDPMFKAEFSGFFMVGGGSLGIKINSSGERTQSASGQNPATNPLNLDTKSARFDFAVGTGYNFTLTPEKMYLAAEFMAYIPVTDTYNFPGVSNSVFTLKVGAALKFAL
jgi:hypothetical protein